LTFILENWDFIADDHRFAAPEAFAVSAAGSPPPSILDLPLQHRVRHG